MAFSLLHHNTFGIAATCNRFVEYSTPAQLKEILPTLHEHKWLHIGTGSNLLFVQPHFNGTILHSRILGKELLAENNDALLIRVGAGESWDDFVAYCVGHHYYGLENLSLIPGEVGASAVQNIGAYGVEVGNNIERVETLEVLSGRERIFHHDECRYAYRSSLFKAEATDKYIVTHVVYRLQKNFTPNLSHAALPNALNAAGIPLDQATAAEVRETIIGIRRTKLPDPSEIGNAGSFFMNPIVSREKATALLAQYPDMPHYNTPDGIKVPAGWLIEQCGWKGRTLGRAGVHAQQALVLINVDHATGQDIAALAQAIRQDVLRKFDISIQPEVRYI